MPSRSESKSRDRDSSSRRDRDDSKESDEKIRANSAADDSRSKSTAVGEEEAKAKARREKYSKKFKETKKVAALTEEERHNAMLGRGYAPGKEDPMLSMEQYCGCCGVEHKAPELLDTYYLCAACQNALREPRVLREVWAERPQACKLEICYATYGHPSLPIAYEVTKAVQSRVDEIWYRDRLQYKKIEDLNKLFGKSAGLPESKWDPCPGQNKQLKVRYRLIGMHAQLQLDVMPNGLLTQNFMLIAPKTRYLIINRATYGHPKGLSPQGRMSVDVTEVVQGIVDSGMSGGSYLTLSYMRPVKPIFGDPCPGYPKDLRVNFEVCGRSGEIVNDEIRGHLIQRVHLEFSPTIKPLIFVLSATYGITPTGRKTRMDEIRRLLKKIDGIDHRKMNGAMPNRDELKLLFERDELKADFEMLRDAEVGFVDIRDKLQRLADGRTLLHLCIEARNEEAALYLINAKANIEARTVFRRRTPLFHATLQSMEAVVQRLIDENADVNVEDSIFATPLRHAIEAGNLEICKIIVSSNRVDKHFVGNQGTVAEIAFYEGNIDILKYLVCDAGFDPHLDDDELFHAYTQMQSESEEYPDHFSYVLIFAQGLEVCHNKGYVLSPLANSYMDTIHREIPLSDQVSWEIGCKWWVKPNKCQNDESVWANYVMDETQH